jgi:hypothetical protein
MICYDNCIAQLKYHRFYFKNTTSTAGLISQSESKLLIFYASIHSNWLNHHKENDKQLVRNVPCTIHYTFKCMFFNYQKKIPITVMLSTYVDILLYGVNVFFI